VKIGAFAPFPPASTPARAASRPALAFMVPGEARPAAPPARTAPALPLDVVSPAGDALEKRRRGLRKGRSMLAALEALRLAVLAGAADDGAFGALAQELAERPEAFDPALDDILGHIRLRAAVELAKAEVRRAR
jgi:hypothetical protein